MMVADAAYDVVADLEASARRIIDHCGLAWHPNCIAFHETRPTVRKARATEVRRPIYRTSEGRWRPYERHLGPLLAARCRLPAFNSRWRAGPSADAFDVKLIWQRLKRGADSRSAREQSAGRRGGGIFLRRELLPVAALRVALAGDPRRDAGEWPTI